MNPTNTMMNLKHLLLYLCVTSIACFPSRPLDDRPSQLEWQAWLLVDAQNPNEGDRRITPKSVFIAPNIGDNNSGSILPDCAEGYRSDPMGRCIKFVKVDEAAHLDFLLQRLNAMYATKPNQELDDETKPTSGPLQVNIPLGGGGGVFASLEEKDPEIAIIVAPTNGNFDEESKDKEINKRTQNVEKVVKEDSTTIESTTLETTEASTTMDSSSDDLQALFFLSPINKTDHVQINRTTTTPLELTSTELLDTVDTDNSTPEIDGDTDPPAVQVKAKPNLETVEEFEPDTSDTHSSFIRFPNTDSSTIKFPYQPEIIPEAHRLTSSEIEHLFKEYISQKPDTDVTRRRPISESTYFDTDEILTQPQIPRPQQYIFNHRNRDRSDFWRQSPTYREATLQKPLVIRYNRHPYSQERVSGEQQYYERPSEDFSQVFGRKRRRGNLR